AKQKLIAETRRWMMRDLRSGRGANGSNDMPGRPSWVIDLFEQFLESEIERWSADTWEAVTLEILWRVCRDGVRGLPAFTPPIAPATRHRDLLLQATGVDVDLQVNAILTRFSAAFVDQGFAPWPLPERETGFFHAFASLYRRRGG